MVHRIRLIFFALLIIILNFVRLRDVDGQDLCLLQVAEVCLLDSSTISQVSEWFAVLPPADFQPPEGAGEVILPPSSVPPPDICTVTPSTGQMSGMNVRALPGVESEIIGDIQLGEFREVFGRDGNWYEVRTRGGRPGFVAAHVSTLQGPCGDVLAVPQ